MSIFKKRKSINQLLEEANIKGIEDNLASSLALVMMKSEFPNKFPKDKGLETRGTFYNDTIEIIANLKINKDEIYSRDIKINGKNKKYKIILRKDTIKEWEKRQRNKEVQEEKIKQAYKKKDDGDFIRMMKSVGIILLLVCAYFIIRYILF